MSNFVVAMNLQEASLAAVANDAVRDLAIGILENHYSMDFEELRAQLFTLCAMTSATAVSYATSVLMSDEDFDSMMNDVSEIEGMGL